MTIETTEQTKVCAKCGVEKPLVEFRLLNNRWRVNSCDSCRRAQMMDYHHRTWPERYARHKKVKKQRTREYYKDTLKPRNLALYGKCSSPKARGRTRTMRLNNKQQTGYAKTETERLQSRQHFLLLRTKVIALYGGRCECCGEARYDMLTFDHKVKTYYKDKVHGVALVYDALHEHERSGYPNHKYRLLCWNCNVSRGHHGYCPHESGYQEHEYRNKKIKLETIDAYGGHCSLCGETHWEFLTIDHVNGGGSRHREIVGSGGTFYRWLKNRGWPKDEYRLLCANCNCSLKRNGWSKKEVPKLGRVLCSCFSCGCVSA